MIPNVFGSGFLRDAGLPPQRAPQRAVKVITGPASEPVTLAEAKLHVRQDIDADDTLITGLIAVARETVEGASWYAMLTQTVELVLDRWPYGNAIELPRPPLQSVTSIKYTDSNGVETTWDPVNYIVDADSVPGRVVLAYSASWPLTALRPTGAIRIRYVAGWPTAADVPQTMKQAMLLLVGHWYENREATGNTVNTKAEIARGVADLLKPFRDAVRRH